jgi:hypothetical protein
MTRNPQDPNHRRAIELAERHRIPEEEVFRLLGEHDGDGLEEALRNLGHFLRAPS